MDEITLLKSGADELGVPLSDAALGAFGVYLSALLKWNAKVNLTSITSPREIVVKHFLDSIALSRLLPADAFSAVDIGSGAGFPGLALKAALGARIALTLVEPAHKKAAFLREAARLMGLKDVSVRETRIETLSGESTAPPLAPGSSISQARALGPAARSSATPGSARPPRFPHAQPAGAEDSSGLERGAKAGHEAGSSIAGRFDAVFSRAFKAPLELLAVAEPLLGPGGAVYLSLGPREESLEENIPAGWAVLRTENITLPFSDYKRTLVAIQRKE